MAPRPDNLRDAVGVSSPDTGMWLAVNLEALVSERQSGCFGKQQTWEDIRGEKSRLYKELASQNKRRGDKTYDYYFLRYVPADLDKNVQSPRKAKSWKKQFGKRKSWKKQFGKKHFGKRKSRKKK